MKRVFLYNHSKAIAFVLMCCMLFSISCKLVIADDTVDTTTQIGIGNITETEILTDFPEIIAGKTTKNHIQRISSKEELNTLVYANDDGTETLYMFDTNVKYVDSSGNIQDKNTVIQASTNGFENQSNDIRVIFPNDVSEGVKLEYGGFSV